MMRTADSLNHKDARTIFLQTYFERFPSKDFVSRLADAIQKQGGVERVAKLVNIDSNKLLETLHPEANPSFDIIYKILHTTYAGDALKQHKRNMEEFISEA